VTASPKTLATWAGRVFLLVALVFVGLKFRSHWTDIAAWRPDPMDAALLAGLSVFYGASLYLLTEVWHRIVNLFASLPRARTYRSFTSTQIAKYIPGNIAHLVGRGFHLRGNTLSDGQIVKATIIELAIVPAAAVVCVIALGSAGLLTGLVPPIPVPLWWLAVLAAICTGLAATAVATRRFPNAVTLLPGLSAGLALSLLFMVCLGASFSGLYQILAPAPAAPLAGAAILAWLIGFLVPGAPGGIGIREAVLIALLGNLGAENTVLLAAALFRLVTTAGDVFLFATGLLIYRAGKDKTS